MQGILDGSLGDSMARAERLETDLDALTAVGGRRHGVYSVKQMSSLLTF